MTYSPVTRIAPDGTVFSSATRNIPTIAEHAAGIVPAGYATVEKFAPVARGLVRPNGYRTTAPVPADESWAIVALHANGTARVRATGTLSAMADRATAMDRHPSTVAGTSHIVVPADTARAMVPA